MSLFGSGARTKPARKYDFANPTKTVPSRSSDIPTKNLFSTSTPRTVGVPGDTTVCKVAIESFRIISSVFAVTIAREFFAPQRRRGLAEASGMQKAQMTEGSEEKEGAEKDRSVKLRLHGGDEGARRAREAPRQVSQTAMRAASISRCGPHYLS